MPFDLSTAKPVSGGFDLSTARPIDAEPEAPAAAPATQPQATSGISRYFEGINKAAGEFNRAKPAGLGGTLEALGTIVTAPIATAVGGISGAVLGKSPEDQEQLAQSVTERLTYSPRSESGKAQLGLLGAIASPLTESGTDIALAPLASQLHTLPRPAKIPANGNAPRPAGAAVPDQPMVVGKDVAGGKTRPVVKGSAGKAGLEQVPEVDPIQSARDAGYKLKPSETGAKAGGLVEGLTGSARLETSLAFKNQRNTDRLAREDFGLPKGPITRGAIDKKRAPHNAVYKQVSALGDVAVDSQFADEVAKVGRTPGESFANDKNPEVESLKSAYVDEGKFNAADAVLKIRELRYKSGKNIGSQDPAKQELGYAQRAIAEALDNQLERHAASVGKADLVKRYRSARQELAKLHNLEIASRGGEVDAIVLGKMLERGVPLSGNLRKIAETANNFPNVMRPGRKLKGNTEANMTDTAIAAAAALASGNPLALGGLAIRPATRAILSSDRYQNSLAKPKNATAQNAPRKEKPANAMLEY